MRSPAKYLVIALLLAMALGMNSYFERRRWGAEQRLAQIGFPHPNLSDVYPCWVATRELLLHGRDPYSSEITREIQRGYYGRPLDLSRPTDPIDQQRFSYPLFVVFLFAPLAYFPFSAVQWFVSVLLCAAAILSIIFWIRALDFLSQPALTVILILATFSTLPYAADLQQQQLSMLVAALVAAGVWAFVRGKIVAAGILLAFATFKPQLSIGISVCLLFWSFCNWKSQKRFAIMFLVTLFALVAGAEFLLRRCRANSSEVSPYTFGTRVGQHPFMPSWGRSLDCLC